MDTNDGAGVDALVVSPPAPVWGAQLYLLDQVPALDERGISLTLASPAGTPFADEWSRRGHPLVDLPLELHAGLRKPGSLERQPPTAMIRTAFGIIKGTRTLASVAKSYDMMYSFSLRSHVEVVAAGRLARTPVALDLVDIVRPGMGRRVLRAAARAATLTVANSAATASVLSERAPVRIIHPGIDLDRFQPGEADPDVRRELSGGADRPLIAVIGRIDPLKGVHHAVEAVAMLKGDAADARLVIVGTAGTASPAYADELRVTAPELLGDRVLFTGRRDDIASVLRAVDVLVVASLAEPFGLTALEAQAVGTPVVGTDSGGLVEFVENEVTGLLVPPNDPTSMARAIERVLDDAALRSSIVAEAQRRAIPARGVAAQADELAAMYRDVANRSVGDG